MISDAIFECLEKIERYQTDEVFKKAYESTFDELENLKTVMRGVQMLFDSPPTGLVEIRGVQVELQMALATLNVAPIGEAIEKLTTYCAHYRTFTGG